LIYRVLGPPLLRFAVTYVRRRYRRQIRIAVAVAVGGAALAVYAANREVPEG
jgi:hypothetical protein